MTVGGPRVQDFTNSTDDLPLEVHASALTEMILSLFVQSGETSDGSCDYECGSIFFEQTNEAASAELRTALDEFAGCGELWLSLLGHANETTPGGDITRFLETVAGMDPVELRLLVMRNTGLNERHGLTTTDLDAAARGDHEVIERIVEKTELRALLLRDPDDFRDRIVEVMGRYHDEVFSQREDVTAALQRDAADKQLLSRSMRADALVEVATGGVTFRMQPSVSRILLIPSVVIRPWAVISEHGTTRIFCYSVADHHLVDDPDAPPTFLLELYKALGDERRLRLLTILAEGDSDLKSLSERIDVGKSTTHHHLRILRGAGLVRVLVGDDDKKYSLRKEGIAEAGPLLEQFIISRPHTN